MKELREVMRGVKGDGCAVYGVRGGRSISLGLRNARPRAKGSTIWWRGRGGEKMDITELCFHNN